MTVAPTPAVLVLGPETQPPASGLLTRVQWHRTGITIPPGLAFDEWLELGEHLKLIEGAIQFALGDWLEYGERAYGEKYSQAVSETGYTHGTLRNMAWVAREIPPEDRDEQLTYSHHRVLAGLEPEQRAEYRELLREQPMTVGELTARVKAKEPSAAMVHVPAAQLEDLRQLAKWAPSDQADQYRRKWGAL